jgi:hypothetical protein
MSRQCRHVDVVAGKPTRCGFLGRPVVIRVEDGRLLTRHSARFRVRRQRTVNPGTSEGSVSAAQCRNGWRPTGLLVSEETNSSFAATLTAGSQEATAWTFALVSPRPCGKLKPFGERFRHSVSAGIAMPHRLVNAVLAVAMLMPPGVCACHPGVCEGAAVPNRGVADRCPPKSHVSSCSHAHGPTTLQGTEHHASDHGHSSPRSPVGPYHCPQVCCAPPVTALAPGVSVDFQVVSAPSVFVPPAPLRPVSVAPLVPERFPAPPLFISHCALLI